MLNWAGPRGSSPDIIVSGDEGIIHLWPSAPYYDLYPAADRPLTQLISYIRPAWLADKLMKPTHQRVRRRIPDADRQGYLTEMREFLAAVAEGLGDNRYLLGTDKPTSFDAAVFGMTVIMFQIRDMHPEITDYFRSLPKLRAYIENLLREFFPELESAAKALEVESPT